MNLTTIINNLIIVATNSNLVNSRRYWFCKSAFNSESSAQLAWQVGNKQKRGQAGGKTRRRHPSRRGDKSCGEDGGPCFFRVLTLATFLFMCGTSTNGFHPLKFSLLSSRRFENRRVEVEPTGRCGRWTRAVFRWRFK